MLDVRLLVLNCFRSLRVHQFAPSVRIDYIRHDLRPMYSAAFFKALIQHRNLLLPLLQLVNTLMSLMRSMLNRALRLQIIGQWVEPVLRLGLDARPLAEEAYQVLAENQLGGSDRLLELE